MTSGEERPSKFASLAFNAIWLGLCIVPLGLARLFSDGVRTYPWTVLPIAAAPAMLALCVAFVLRRLLVRNEPPRALLR
jgi:hypothetical protein